MKEMYDYMYSLILRSMHFYIIYLTIIDNGHEISNVMLPFFKSFRILFDLFVELSNHFFES